MGNQCFIYAAARALSLRADAELILNVDKLRADAFGRKFSLGPFVGVPQPLPASPAPVRGAAILLNAALWRLGVETRTRPCESRPVRFRPFPTDWRGRLVVRNGYWQSERYFDDCRGQILRDFRLKDDSWLGADAMARRIAATENSVFLHVRTYKEVPGREDGRFAARMSGYYRNALRHLAEHLPSATVFVFSDDVAMARRNVLTEDALRGVPFDFVYADDGGGQLRDFTLMRMCRHGIMADSSFSWWAGWLGEQERLARGESAMRLHVDRSDLNDDYWPDRWTAVGG